MSAEQKRVVLEAVDGKPIYFTFPQVAFLHSCSVKTIQRRCKADPLWKAAVVGIGKGKRLKGEVVGRLA